MNRNLLKILVFSVIVAILYFYYYPIFQSPNSYLFADSGDGIKNYFTYIYHIINDAGGLNSTSMNYPFGESIFFLDSNPTLAKFIKLLPLELESKKSISIGIYNLLMLLSIPLSGVLLFNTGIELKLNRLGAFCSAVGLSLLTPTLLRMTGHFSLSLSFFIPLAILLSIQWFKYYRKRTLFYFFASSIVSYGIHPYLGMIMSSIIICFTISHALTSPKYWINKEHLYALFTGFLPLVLFYILVSKTDTHLGRTDNPYGFLVYRAYPLDLVIPSIGPIRHYLSKIVSLPSPHWEGLCYLGFSVILAWVYGIAKLKKRLLTIFSTDTKHVLISSSGLWLFAAGMPFILGLSFVADWFPIIKSFRSTGRCAWPFYFAMGIGAFLIIQELFKNNKRLQSVVFVVAALLLIWESHSFHSTLSNKFKNIPNQFNSNQLDTELKEIVNANFNIDFILPFPFFFHGSDNFVIEEHRSAKKGSMLLSYHLNKPISAMAAARTSIPESRSGISYTYNFFSDIKPSNNKNILLFFDRSEKLEYPETVIFDCFKQDSSNAKYVGISINESEYFGAYFKYHLSDSTLKFPLYYDGFNTNTTKSFISPPGSKRIERGTIDTIVDYVHQSDSASINISFWVLNNNEINYGQDYIIGNDFDLKINGEKRKSFRTAASKIVNGNWTQVYFRNISIKRNDNLQIQIKVKRKMPSQYLFIDDIQFVETHEYSLIKLENEYSLFNNFPIQLSNP